MSIFSEKICLITGGASGIGLAIAKAFSINGVHTVIFDVNNDAGVSACDLLSSQGISLKFVPIDLCMIEKAKEVFLNVLESSESISDIILINNARSGKRLSLLDETEENWDLALTVGLKSMFFLSQTLIDFSVKRRVRSIICNIGSIASTLVTPESPSYHATKSGVLQITKYLAVHGGKYGARVNCVLPGFIVQERHLERFHGSSNEHYRNLAYQYHPLGEIGTEQDVVNAVIWLCSDESKYITGASISIDGGAPCQEQFSMLLNATENL
jgi:NAD(P)-dependent dehydrogenase (short-subunit alcohol dehydrogenase family)